MTEYDGIEGCYASCFLRGFEHEHPSYKGHGNGGAPVAQCDRGDECRLSHVVPHVHTMGLSAERAWVSTMRSG